ncbi:MAG: hypothetical protein AAF772_09060 [Acidobacteriota bacterium]
MLDFRRMLAFRRCPAPGPLSLRLALILLLAALFTACAPAARDDPAQARPELESALRDYLPQLAEAYRVRDATVLEGVAVEKEIATVHRWIEEATARGEWIDTTLGSMTIEDVSVSRGTAYVNTLEVWDVVRHAHGSDEILARYDDQRYRVRYQMGRDMEGAWQVYFRQSTRLETGG